MGKICPNSSPPTPGIEIRLHPLPLAINDQILTALGINVKLHQRLRLLNTRRVLLAVTPLGLTAPIPSIEKSPKRRAIDSHVRTATNVIIPRHPTLRIRTVTITEIRVPVLIRRRPRRRRQIL